MTSCLERLMPWGCLFALAATLAVGCGHDRPSAPAAEAVTPRAPVAPRPPAAPPPAVGSGPGRELTDAINAYRGQNGLPPIPISKSLLTVADAHVRDLRASPRLAPSCNAHSWSARGPWTPCCYTSDHAQAKCMWQKPAELTPFKATGFEIAIGEPGVVSSGFVLDTRKAIAIWQRSSAHNDVILNRGMWQKRTWRAIGAAMIDSHATAWFSDQADPAP